MHKSSVLLVEDNIHMGQLLSESFEAEGFEIKWEINGIEAWKNFLNSTPDICILDIMLPGIDGIELAKRIKKRDPKTPIIFLTARSLKSDVISGYETGCDDYIIKPFEEYHLLLKVKALLSRQSEKLKDQPKVITLGNFQLDLVKRQMKWDREQRKINRLENQILMILMNANEKLVLRDQILESVWGRNDIYTSKSLDTYLYNIRKYLKETELVLENIYGSGYLLRVDKQ